MDHPLAVAFIRWIVLLPLAGAVFNFAAGATLQKKLGRWPDAAVVRQIFTGQTGVPPDRQELTN
ncbi:MAG: hypothetical protein ACREQD_09265, partial [Candidatus Binataceae bacterium]